LTSFITRIVEKTNDEIMALHFSSPFNAEFLQTVEEFGVSHQIGGLQIGQTCPDVTAMCRRWDNFL